MKAMGLYDYIFSFLWRTCPNIQMTGNRVNWFNSQKIKKRKSQILFQVAPDMFILIKADLFVFLIDYAFDILSMRYTSPLVTGFSSTSSKSFISFQLKSLIQSGQFCI